MLSVETRHAVHPEHAKGMDSEALRRHFLAQGLFAAGEIRLVYTHYDRFTLGAAVPSGAPLTLDRVEATRTPGFLDRREMGIVNVGAAGRVSAGGMDYDLDRGDVLYLGMGTGPVTFSGAGRYYLTSAPAHRAIPARLIRLAQARAVPMGAAETCNERTIHQFLHPDVQETCQLCLGYTRFKPGSVWNTMPAHLHDRRMEAYLYFDLAADNRVLHLMGEPTETRHLWVSNEEAILSPPWSVHAGAGTGAYTFIWAMAGDNTDFSDMDAVPMAALR